MEPDAHTKGRVKFINPNILHLHESLSHKINRHNVEKIIDEIIQSEHGSSAKKAPLNISIDDIKFPDEERLKQLLLHHMFIKNKGFEYLIAPSHSKKILSQILSSAASRNKLSHTAR